MLAISQQSGGSSRPWSQAKSVLDYSVVKAEECEFVCVCVCEGERERARESLSHDPFFPVACDLFKRKR